MDMEGFEDGNPFEQDGDQIPSETSSMSKVAIYEPSSPPVHPSRALSPTSPSHPSSFGSAQGHTGPPANFRTDFCCTRDRYLHTNEDIEIVVSCNECCALGGHSHVVADRRCSEDQCWNKLALHRICDTHWGVSVSSSSLRMAHGSLLGR